MSTNNDQVKLQSSDGEIFVVDLKAAECSKLIKDMLDNLGVGGGDENLIPILNVNSKILPKIIDWANHHKVFYLCFTYNNI